MEKYIKPEIEIVEVVPTSIMDASLDKNINGDTTDSYLGKENGGESPWDGNESDD